MTPQSITLGDLKVRRLGFGAMRVCGPQVWGWPKDRAAAFAVLRRAYELGHNFFDTSDAYGPEVNESRRGRSCPIRGLMV
jgi:aryl-alcohol dehydrogenase-like predicted oxidoreductase